MNSQSRLFEQNFMRANIPYRLVGGLSFFKRKEIKDLVAYLRLILDSRDDFSFERIINVPARGVGAITLGKFASKAMEMDISIMDSLPIQCQSLNCRPSKKMMIFYDMINSLRTQMDQLFLKEFIDLVLVETGYLAELQAEDTIESQSRIDNLEEFKSMAVSFEREQLPEFVAREEMELTAEQMTTSQKLEILLADIVLQTDVTEEDVNQEKVTMMTIHAAKGLEFDTVFLVGFEDGMFPLQSAIDSGDDAMLEEERRLAYVAVTRAKRRLYITNARSRMHQGRPVYHKISRFQDEINSERLEILSGGSGDFAPANKSPFFAPNRSTVPTKPKPTIPKPALSADNPFATGDKIAHDKLGDGIVVATTGDTVTIAFSVEHGIKKLKAGHPAIKLKN